jgi:mRNA-degrading endonuclease RelE of RelBE toxin-antitoxin system
MSGWTVEWLSEAEDDLADIWLNAPDRKAVNAAQNEIDRLLSQDPVNNGKLLSEGLYRIRIDPLKAFSQLDEANRLVSVSNVTPSS